MRVIVTHCNQRLVVEPVTGKHIPKEIKLHTNVKEDLFKLISIGVRQVTLFYISVYTIGLYASDNAFQSLLGSHLDADRYLKGDEKQIRAVRGWIRNAENKLALRIGTLQ